MTIMGVLPGATMILSSKLNCYVIGCYPRSREHIQMEIIEFVYTIKSNI